MDRSLAVMLIALAPPASALAHEGHGWSDPASPTHYVMEPTHSAPLIAAFAAGVLVAAVGLRLLHRRKR